jgi:hypothetical protein
MSTKNMGYDHAAYIARLSHSFGANTAGAAWVTGKFIAFTALTVFAVNATLVTLGSSTHTAWNGTATTTSILSGQYSVIRIMNTAAAGATPALSTATYGPFSIALYNGTATGTQTNAAGFTNNVALSGTATTGTAQAGSNTATGGFTVNQGDQLYIVGGTDASIVAGFSLEYGVTPLSNVTA